MKIRLAILDDDISYLQRITSVFTSKYSEQIEIYTFTDINLALSSLSINKVNVFLASEAFNIDVDKLPRFCGFSYFVESSSIDAYNDAHAICKYQKAEMIYKTIIEIFSENISESIKIKFDSGSNVQVVTFVSASGGVGSSCAAAACAKSFAMKGRKILYLNLEQFGSTELFFSGEGQANFGDVIFDLKSKRINLILKMESYVRRDASGVFFYTTSKTALDMTELKAEEIEKLITDLKLAGSYDVIVFDINFSFNESIFEIFKQSSSVVFVSDGSEISNVKLMRAYKAMEIMDEKLDTPLLPRICLFYNKFSNKTGKALDEGIRTIGGAPKYDRATIEQVVSQLVKLEVFQRILESPTIAVSKNANGDLGAL